MVRYLSVIFATVNKAMRNAVIATNAKDLGMIGEHAVSPSNVISKDKETG